ncbi:putative anoctamin-7 isoform X3 [Apostichopus japonicus]|uniref:Anoctamin n=1 Tax=Stichopus japonicus TaxID=307972 RepID=A0A2G8LDN1_STIJA|nr:putative anoctamin-7 isoform X3 [Apostichopus japonicus]
MFWDPDTDLGFSLGEGKEGGGLVGSYFHVGSDHVPSPGQHSSISERNFPIRGQSIASMSGAVVNLVLIMVLGQVYQRLAGILNDWEMHRTQTEYEDNLTFKVFIFQFMNFFSSVFYIAFIKGKLSPNKCINTRIYVFNIRRLPWQLRPSLRSEERGLRSGGCLIELAQQLIVIMVGKQIINNCQELIIPKVKQLILRWKVSGSFGRNSDSHLSRWEEDYQLVPNEGLFEEYLEMVIQFGFITVFVAAFPLAPLFALLNNWIEIRLDAQKFIGELRRGLADRAQDIGIWYDILEFTAQLAVISNGFLIAFTSQFLPRLLYHHDCGTLQGYTNFTLAYSPENSTHQECRYQDYRDDEGNHTIFYYRLLALRLGFVIVFEHFVFGISRAIDFVVPDVPESLEVKIKREAYLAKQALQEVQPWIFGSSIIIKVEDFSGYQYICIVPNVSLLEIIAVNFPKSISLEAWSYRITPRH